MIQVVTVPESSPFSAPDFAALPESSSSPQPASASAPARAPAASHLIPFILTSSLPIRRDGMI